MVFGGLMTVPSEEWGIGFVGVCIKRPDALYITFLQIEYRSWVRFSIFVPSPRHADRSSSNTMFYRKHNLPRSSQSTAKLTAFDVRGEPNIGQNHGPISSPASSKSMRKYN